MADLKVEYDRVANAAYIYFTDPQDATSVAHMYPCDPTGVGGMINLDFDGDGRLIGIEVLAADSKLPRFLLEAAETISREGARGAI